MNGISFRCRCHIFFQDRRWGRFSIIVECVPLVECIMGPVQLGNNRVKVMTPTTNPSSSIVSAFAVKHAIAKLVSHWFDLSVCRVLADAAPATPRRQLEISGLDSEKHYKQLGLLRNLDCFIATSLRPLTSGKLWHSGIWVGDAVVGVILFIEFLYVSSTHTRCYREELHRIRAYPDVATFLLFSLVTKSGWDIDLDSWASTLMHVDPRSSRQWFYSLFALSFSSWQFDVIEAWNKATLSWAENNNADYFRYLIRSKSPLDQLVVNRSLSLHHPPDIALSNKSVCALSFLASSGNERNDTAIENVNGMPS